METKVQVACLFAGIVDHWHEGIIYPDGTRSLYKCSCMEHQSTEPLSRLNPDPLHNDGDYWRLVKGMMRHEGYRQFEEFADNEYLTEFVPPIEVFTAWLLLDPARFISLIWDWTGLEKVQEKYGMTECPTCWKPGDYTGALPVFCPTCNGSGHLPAPWLEERRKG